MKACYPGTFDPVTTGHMDMIKRCAQLFDETDVLIMVNPRKQCLFTAEERKEMIEASLKEENVTNVNVVTGTGLTVMKAKELGCQVIVRGVRTVTDYEYEVPQATANMYLSKDIETVFLIAKPELSYISSSVVKEIAMNGGSIKGLVPDVILETVEKKYE